MLSKNGDWAALRKAQLIASMAALRGSRSPGNLNPGLRIPVNVNGPDVDETPVNVNGPSADGIPVSVIDLDVDGNQTDWT